MVSVPADAQDPAVAKLEAYRKKAKGAPVTYLIGQIDDSNGASDLNMYSVVVVTDDGQQITADGVSAAVEEWQQAFGTSDTKNYNDGVNLINASEFFLRPGAKGTVVLVADQAISSVRRVFVYPAGGMDEVEMTKASG